MEEISSCCRLHWLSPQFLISFGKNIATDLDSEEGELTCISRPILANWVLIIEAYLIRSSLVLATTIPSSA